MRYLVCVVTLVCICGVAVSEIATSKLINKLFSIKPVGLKPDRRFMALTEIPPPALPPTLPSARRKLDQNCDEPVGHREVFGGARVHIFGDYYEEKFYMTVATIIFPDHIDHHHFEVTTSPPYYTLKHTIPGIGFYPTTPKQLDECEKLYLDHIAEYSEASDDQSDESLEMAKPPFISVEETVYSDFDLEK